MVVDCVMSCGVIVVWKRVAGYVNQAYRRMSTLVTVGKHCTLSPTLITAQHWTLAASHWVRECVFRCEDDCDVECVSVCADALLEASRLPDPFGLSGSAPRLYDPSRSKVM